MSLLEVKNLQVRVDDVKFSTAFATVNKRRVTHHGPNGSGNRRLSHVHRRQAGYEVTRGEILFEGGGRLEMAPDERAARASPRLPVSGGNPGVATMTSCARRSTPSARRAAKRILYPDFLKKVRAVAASLNIPQDMLPVASMWFRRREKRTRFCRWRVEAEPVHPRPRWIPPRHRRAGGSPPTASTRCVANRAMV